VCVKKSKEYSKDLVAPEEMLFCLPLVRGSAHHNRAGARLCRNQELRVAHRVQGHRSCSSSTAQNHGRWCFHPPSVRSSESHSCRRGLEKKQEYCEQTRDTKVVTLPKGGGTMLTQNKVAGHNSRKTSGEDAPPACAPVRFAAELCDTCARETRAEKRTA
jgi:hypothetical protein